MNEHLEFDEIPSNNLLLIIWIFFAGLYTLPEMLSGVRLLGIISPSVSPLASHMLAGTKTIYLCCLVDGGHMGISNLSGAISQKVDGLGNRTEVLSVGLRDFNHSTIGPPCTIPNF